MLIQILFAAVFIGSCGAAFRWGGFDERCGAIGLMIAALVSNVVTLDFHYAATGFELFAIDAALFVGLVILALRSDRFWPLWASAFQLVATLVHIGSIFQSGDFAWAYYVALAFWSFPVMVALGAGTWLEGRLRSGRFVAA